MTPTTPPRRRKIGSTRSRVPPVKIPVNAKFDRDVVDWFKSQGRGYQARMNSVLRSYMQAKTKAETTRH